MRGRPLVIVGLMWARHGNGEGGFVYDGWLRRVAPGVARPGTPAYAVTWRGLR